MPLNTSKTEASFVCTLTVSGDRLFPGALCVGYMPRVFFRGVHTVAIFTRRGRSVVVCVSHALMLSFFLSMFGDLDMMEAQ